MSKKLDKIRKKIESRRREIHGKGYKRERSAPMLFNRHDEAREEPDFYLYQEREETEKGKWLEKDWFIMRTLIAITVFFVVAIVFNSGLSQLEGARQFVKNSYEQEIQFTAVADWYENQFGRPLALLPMGTNVAMEDTEQMPEVAYAVPATGSIMEDFSQNGKGVLVETEAGAVVEAVKSGMVVQVGEDETIGKTVVIRHYDGGEAWYGMLDKVEVNLYDHVDHGTTVGKVSDNDQVNKGIYYFALKEGENYIDPSEVISFD